MTPRFPRRGTPESFGWVRDPDADRDCWLAWEMPDGILALLHPSVGRLVQFMPCLPPVPDMSEADDAA